MSRLLALLIALAALIPTSSAASPRPPPIRHVFVVVLENKSYSESFGHPDSAPYLTRTLPAQGQLLSNYYGVTHLSLGNYIAMVSGQASNLSTQTDCQFYTDLLPGTIGADGQAVGQGCVYPRAVQTIANQLAARGLTWRGYMEDMGNGAGQPQTCRHPTIGSQDKTQSARVGDQYAARHNPFVYFHSIIDDQAGCDANDVPLDRLPGDLASESTTRNYSFIVPNLCDDGHDGGGSAHCVDGRPGGLTSANEWLATWIPKILASPAFKRDGLLIVTFDEAEALGGSGDASACCDQLPGPNTPNPGGLIPGAGGGRIGTVVVSPFIAPGTVNPTPYNHYSMLRSVEDIFGLSHLGYAAQANLRAFGDDVYTRPQGPAAASPPARPPGHRSGCHPPPLPRPRNGRYRRGSVLRSATLLPRRHGTRRTLRVSLRRDARLLVLLRIPGENRTRVISNKRVHACRAYRGALPGSRGRLVVRASVAGASELRTLSYATRARRGVRPRFTG